MSTRDQLIKEAERLFAFRGFYGVSIKDIADELDITKQALLHYFGNKEKLYGEVLQKSADEIMLSIENASATSDELGERFCAIIDAMSSYLEDNTDQARLILRELLDNPARAPKAMNWYLAPFLETLSKEIEVGQELGVFKPVDPMAFIMMVIGAQHYFIVSAPTLKQILSAKAYKKTIKTQRKELNLMVRGHLFADSGLGR